MSKVGFIKSVIKEYGLVWAFNRTIYSLKLKMMSMIAITEKLYEKTSPYPNKTDTFDVDNKALTEFIGRMDDTNKAELIHIADNACCGVIRGFSSVELNYGNPIDWQLNPLTGNRCNGDEKWFRISDFDEYRGDIKTIWEASRFSHFITLARAYLLTGELKYYEAFSEQLKSWLIKNKYSYGANYKCGQECSFRMVNALLAYTVFRNAGIATDADDSNIRDLIDRCYRKILSNFFYAYKCIKNNHTISELMGMIIGAWCCEDDKQLRKAYSILDKVIDEQFSEDGGYKQFSFNYQRLALQDIEIIIEISRKTGMRLGERSIKKIENSAMLMYQCLDKTGDMPNYGSNDGALVFPVSSCGYRDFRPIINAISSLTRGIQLFKDGLHQEELIWFSGGKTLKDYPYKEIKQFSSGFNQAGLFTLRGNDSWIMMISNKYSSRPGHMDQNHVDLWVSGVNVFCDSGTYSYASTEGRLLAKNKSHNTVVIEGRDQMNIYGPFMIYSWTRREEIKADDNTLESRIVSANGYLHERKIVKINKGYEVTDVVDKDYMVIFNTPCKVIGLNNGFNLEYKGRKICSISTTGEVDVRESQRSLYYLEKEALTCIVITNKKDVKTVTRISF